MVCSERQTQDFEVAQVFLFSNFPNGLNAGLNQIGESRFCPEAGDKKFDFPPTLFIFNPRFFVYFFFLSYLTVIFFGIPFGFSDFVAINPHGVGHQLIHQAPVVGNEQKLMGPVK